LETGKKNKIRLAGFPYQKYLEELSIEDLLPYASKRFKILKNLDFIEGGQKESKIKDFNLFCYLNFQGAITKIIKHVN